MPKSTIHIRLSHVCSKNDKGESGVELWPLGLKVPVNTCSYTDPVYLIKLKTKHSQAICMYMELS